VILRYCELAMIDGWMDGWMDGYGAKEDSPLFRLLADVKSLQIIIYTIKNIPLQQDIFHAF